MKPLRLLLALLFLPAFHTPTYSCSCTWSKPEHAFNEARGVFIGKVIGGTEVFEQKRADGRARTLEAGLIRFSLEEVFKGDLVGQALVFVASMRGTSCGDYGLERGVTYLVYAYGDEKGALHTGVCTRTAAIDSEYVKKEDLPFLRNLPAPGSGGNLNGQVSAFVGGNGSGPMANVKVRVHAEDGHTLTVTTDKEGQFQLLKLKPGRYKVEAEAPEHYVMERSVVDVRVDDRGTAEVWFEATMNGRIAGRIADVNGRGYNAAFLHLVERSADERNRKSRYAHSTGENGEFDADGIAPGEYLLYLELQGRDYKHNKPYYYPGTFNIEDAGGIKVGLDGRVEGLEFTLPETYKIRAIEGTVFWEDGKPAAGVAVMLLCAKSETEGGLTLTYSRIDAQTDAEGRFTLEGVTGEVYAIEARGARPLPSTTDRGEEKSGAFHSPSKKITLKEDLKNVRLILSEKGFSGSCER